MKQVTIVTVYESPNRIITTFVMDGHLNKTGEDHVRETVTKKWKDSHTVLFDPVHLYEMHQLDEDDFPVNCRSMVGFRTSV